MAETIDITDGAAGVDVRGGDAVDTTVEKIATILKGCNSARQLVGLLQRHPQEASSCLQLASDIAADIAARSSPRPENAAAPVAKPSTSVIPTVVKAEVAPSAPVSTDDAHFLFADLPFVTPKGKHNLFIRCDGPDGQGGALILQSKGAAPGSVGPAGVSIPLDSVSGVFSLAVGDRYGKGVTSSILLSLSQPFNVGKQAHKITAVADTDAVLSKAGTYTITLRRDLNISNWKQPAALLALVEGGSTQSSLPAGTVFTAPNSFVLLRAVLEGMCGTIGQANAALFASAINANAVTSITSVAGGAASIGSSSGGPFVRCYHKVSEGVLFPLRKCFIFGFRPLICIPHTDISAVSVARSGMSAFVL